MELGVILVTGSRGFIGSHLIPYLRSLGYKTIGFEGDLLNIESIRDFFRAHSVMKIVHLVGTFEGDFNRQIELNFRTTSNLLLVAEEFRISNIIFSSTGAVYGEPKGDYSSEDDQCFPNTWYGLSKRMAEELIEFYSRNKRFQAVVLRFSSVYGAGSRGVISAFTKSIKEKGKITIHGDGTQSRNFLHVSDAVHAIFLALEKTVSGVFNITNPTKTSLNDLVSLLHKGYEFEIEYVESNSNYLKDLLLSPDKAREILGFEAKQKNILFE